MHRDNRSGKSTYNSADDRLIPFQPGVRRAMEQLADEIEDIPPRGDPSDYAPPDRRQQALAGVRAADYDVDMDKIASAIGADPVSDLKRQITALTYGEMMDACGGILAATENKPISTADELAKVVHKWATTPMVQR